MSILKRVILRVRAWPWYGQVGLGVAVIAVVAVGLNSLTGSEASLVAGSQTPHVKLATVASLSAQNTGPLPVTGNVVSLHHASILAQSSGQVVSLTRSIGDYVPAGGVIAQLENSSQRAAVLQAKGAYDAAQAAFANANGTTAANSNISATQAAQNLANAKASVTTSLQSLYATLDDAIHTKSDTLFTDAGSNPRLLLSVPDSQLVITLQNQRTQLEISMARAEDLANATTRADVVADISTMSGYTQLVSSYLSNLVSALNKAQPNDAVTATQIAAYQTSVGAARSAVASGLGSLPSIKTSYESAAAAAASAANSAGAGTSNSISIAQANVEQAQGVLNAAQAALEKTIIRSPISGTIVSLPLTQGGFVSMNSPVAEVSNPSALEVEAYVTPQDAKTLAVGSAAEMGSGTQGVIVSIAPALDPTTGKILVKLGIVGSQEALTDGDTISVLLSRATAAQIRQTSKTKNTMRIPIVAAKITPSGPVVFTASSSTLEALPVVLGVILGDQVQIASGISPETLIVTDARGLSHGQTVIVDQQ